MILTKEQIEKRTSHEDNIANKLEEERKNSVEVIIKDGLNHQGRNGGRTLSDEERIAIGVLSNTVGVELASELMGVSPNTARHLKTGQTTLNEGHGGQRYAEDNTLKTAIASRLENTKLSVAERAADKLLSTLGLFDDPEVQDKLKNSNPKDIASVATHMSQVVRNMERKDSGDSKGNGGSKVQIILHQPKSSKESSFDVIEVGVK